MEYTFALEANAARIESSNLSRRTKIYIIIKRINKMLSKKKAASLAKARHAAAKKHPCKYCSTLYSLSGKSRHESSCLKNPTIKKMREKNCPVCEKLFYTYSVTCSYSCANKMFRSGENHGNWKEGSYRTTCFLYHEKKCVVCDEKKVLHVHHVNKNTKDNRPSNLIPMCPTHHRYFHSIYADEVKPLIKAYLKEWKKKQKDNK